MLAEFDPDGDATVVFNLCPVSIEVIWVMFYIRYEEMYIARYSVLKVATA
jgi:hypothetical protein